MKKILVLNFFPAFIPPSSGGELRYFHLYEKLSHYFDITLLSPGYTGSNLEIIEHSATYREFRIPKEELHDQIHWKLEQEDFSPEFSALSCAYSANYLNEYHRHYLKLYPQADIIIHDFPYMLNYDLFFGLDNKVRIYNSHNLEFDLLNQIYSGDNAKQHLDYIFKLEKKLVSEAERVFATSSIEKVKFHKLYAVNATKIKLAPNGINPEDENKRKDAIKTNTAFFIGSGHPPNAQAVQFIINDLAPKCPNIDFLIAGSCCSNFSTEHNNVKLLGKVTEKQKQELFATSDITINPMFTGAGTNLKTLEFLSMGIPMVSTDVGVRGVELQDKQHFLLANKEDFAQKIQQLITNKKLKDQLSIAAKTYIDSNFSWHKIAKSIYQEINTIENKNKRTLLLLNDFPVSAPFGGGEVRINRLYSELSKSYSIILLCLNNENTIHKVNITPNFLEISFPKTKEHKKEELRINLQYKVSATDIVNSYMISKNDLFMSAVNAIAPTADITVLCHPYMSEVLQATQCNYLIHESLNYELLLKKELLNKHPLYDELLEQVKKVELSSCTESDLIISVSDDDHQGLNNYRENGASPIVTIRNGVDINTDTIFDQQFSKVKTKFKGHTVILFIGSAHMPNITSAKFILNDLAPKLKDCFFIMIGSVCDAISFDKKTANVLLFGKLEEKVKNVLYSIADIAINPMLGGSGSNLKLAEYFSWKLPTITTEFGARGYDVNHQKEVIICNINDFATNIKELQRNPELAKHLSENAYSYVQSKVEWNILAKQYRDLLDTTVYGTKRKKLLVITYRYTTPPLGGAESYLYETLKHLDEGDNFDITVAYLDAYDIQNQYHFSIDATHNHSILTHNFKNVSFKRFKYIELNEQEKYNNAKELMSTWMQEFLISARKFTEHYTKNILLGGWNFPEKNGNISQIWTSKSADIYLENTKKVCIKGYSSIKKTLTFKLNNNEIKQKEINGTFSIELEINSDGILNITSDAHYMPQDVRPLGVLIKTITCDQNNIDISYGYRDYLKESQRSAYIDELIATANAREEYIEQLFQKTRGLNSKELEDYLDKHTPDFDIVLGHSIPFATTTITAKYALKYNKPYSLLPHYHFDDEFYHWASYYQAMQQANLVFAAPSLSIKQFYDKLDIKAVEIPGGGINEQEYDIIDSAQFLEHHSSSKPYFLILGRKAGAKNYNSIITAIEKLNEKEHHCNLLMIGRDEDGITIKSKHTYYLGEQPREVVLGAIKNCHALVSMSESESFGIVIIEAWMLNKPVIINENCPAFSELVQDNVNGLYATKINLAQKMTTLLENKMLAKELGNNGRKNVKPYTWKGIAKIIEEQLLAL